MIKSRDGGSKISSYSWSWIDSVDPELEDLQDWVKAAVKEGIDTVSRLQSFSAAQEAELEGHVELSYTAPGDKTFAKSTLGVLLWATA